MTCVSAWYIPDLGMANVLQYFPENQRKVAEKITEVEKDLRHKFSRY